MEGKRVSESVTVLAQLMSPQDANLAGNVHGGNIMKLVDEAAGISAYRHARSIVTTASISRLDFHGPVEVGNLVTLRASLHLVGTSSMEVGVRVEAENLSTGEVRHVASAYLTYVALDEAGRPRPVPPLVLETEDDVRRHAAAALRKAGRQAARP